MIFTLKRVTCAHIRARHNLSLPLFQFRSHHVLILCYLIGGLFQIFLASDVVPVKHIARLIATDTYCY